MNLRTSFAVATLVALGGLSGCRVTVETVTKYVGPIETKSGNWQAGKSVVVDVHNGPVALGGDAITVNADGADDKVEVSVKPWALEYEDGKATAENNLRTKLSWSVTVAADGTVNVATNSGCTTAKPDASGSCGYDVTVRLPKSFDANLDGKTNNGSIVVNSVAGGVKTTLLSNNGSVTAKGLRAMAVQSDNGSVNVEGQPTGTSNIVQSKNGSVDFGVAAGSNVTIHAWTGNGTVTANRSDFTVTAQGASDKTVKVGDGTAALDVYSGNGSVTIK